ncbi:MAG: hypothetical protein RIF32_06730 [Leptospirales bacterium]
MQRNIKEYPPLAAKLQRRFALPRALAIFRRLSLRMDLRRIWPDLPYMNFVRPTISRDASENRFAREASAPIQHTSLHTHIALSPVVTRIIRAEYTLPVRELRQGDASREALDRSAPPLSETPPTGDGAQSRLVRLIQVVSRERPTVVRGMARIAGDSTGDASTAASPSHRTKAEDSFGAVADRGLTYSRPDRETLEAIAKENGLESSSLVSLTEGFFGEDAGESTPAPILPPEIQEYLKIDPDLQPGGKRFVARRGPSQARDSSDGDDAPPTARVRTHSPKMRARRPELAFVADAEGTLPGGDANGADRGQQYRAARKNGRDGNADLMVREARRPVIERESDDARKAESASVDAISEAIPEAIVQNTVRKTLRSLPDPDVEAFAARVSRSIERRMQIDRDWRGDL